MPATHTTFISHTVGRFTQAEGEKIRERLQGKTYMQFEVLVCPAGGEWEVIIQTHRLATTQQDLTNMIIHVMAGFLVGY